MANSTTTLILGAGFGGIATANGLRQRLGPQHRVVLVDKSDRFAVGAGFSWVMTGEKDAEDVTRPLAALSRRGIDVRREEVLAIDPKARRVRTSQGELTADYLVLALGADTQLTGVPGLETAHSFYTLSSAERLRDALASFHGGRIVLLIPSAPFKCPPAPYEAALQIKARLQSADLSVHTVEPLPMPTAGPEMGRMVTRLVEQAGVRYYPKRKPAKVLPERRLVVFEDGAEVGYDLLIAIPPHSAPRVVREAGLVNPAGWVPTDPKTLRTSFPQVFAVGDLAALPLPGRFQPDAPLSLPKAGVFAARQGEVVAAQIAAHIQGATPTLEFDGKGYCFLEVGRHQALRAEGEFFAEPQPKMTAASPSSAGFEEKRAWVQSWLDAVAPR